MQAPAVNRVSRHFYAHGNELIGRDIYRLPLFDSVSFISGEYWGGWICAMISSNQNGTVRINFIIEPNQRLLVAVSGDIKTAVYASPRGISIKPHTAFNEICSGINTGYSASC